MRPVVAALIATVLLVPAMSSAKPKPSGKGYIILDGNCDVQATDLDLTIQPNPTSVTVEWKIFNDGCAKAKLAVGIFQAKTDLQYYPLPSPTCKGVVVGPKKTTLTCKLNMDCPFNTDYSYGVCVNGSSVWDPELRIKGGKPPIHGGNCPGDPTKDTARALCEHASE